MIVIYTGMTTYIFLLHKARDAIRFVVTAQLPIYQDSSVVDLALSDGETFH